MQRGLKKAVSLKQFYQKQQIQYSNSCTSKPFQEKSFNYKKLNFQKILEEYSTTISDIKIPKKKLIPKP